MVPVSLKMATKDKGKEKHSELNVCLKSTSYTLPSTATYRIRDRHGHKNNHTNQFVYLGGI